MKKRLILPIFILLFVLLLSFFVNADTGPKPSVNITFENLGEQLCYATLLSKSPSTGPHSAWDGNEEHIYNDSLDLEIWHAFNDYKDNDGYYFLQLAWQVNTTKSFAWTYYPPSDFKILLYFPDLNKFVCSQVCERYAFDTYYTVDMKGVNIGSLDYDKENSTNHRIEAFKSYNYTGEVLSLIARILITIAVEIVIGILFNLRKKKELVFLIILNAITQIFLNVFLNIVRYKSGELELIFLYVFIEIIIVILEALACKFILKRYSDNAKTDWYYIGYALVSNIASFAIGFPLALLVPSIF